MYSSETLSRCFFVFFVAAVVVFLVLIYAKAVKRSVWIFYNSASTKFWRLRFDLFIEHCQEMNCGNLCFHSKPHSRRNYPLLVRQTNWNLSLHIPLDLLIHFNSWNTFSKSTPIYDTISLPFTILPPNRLKISSQNYCVSRILIFVLQTKNLQKLLYCADKESLPKPRKSFGIVSSSSVICKCLSVLFLLIHHQIK